jgi:hypothetical protein
MWNIVEIISGDLPQELEILKAIVYVICWYLLYKIVSIPIDLIASVLKGMRK